MSNTQTPPVRAGEADEDILSIGQEDFAPAPAPATHPQVLDDVFTPPAFLLARDVRREVTDLAPYAPAQIVAVEVLEVEPAEPEATQAPVEVQHAPAGLYDRRAAAEAVVQSTAQEPERAEAAAEDHAAPPREEGRAASRREEQPEPSRAAAPRPDNYAVGMRLLRISPAWLLLSSVGFFGLIFFLSWLYQPASQPETVVAAAGSNHSVNRPAVPPAPVAETAIETKAEVAAPAAPAPAVKTPEAAPAAQPTPAAPVAPAAPAAPAGRFAVQVGSYGSQSEANERVSNLRASGFEARAAAVDIPQRGTWHRVYVGGFGTREEASRHAGELRAKGVAPAGLVVEVK